MLLQYMSRNFPAATDPVAEAIMRNKILIYVKLMDMAEDQGYHKYEIFRLGNIVI